MELVLFFTVYFFTVFALLKLAEKLRTGDEGVASIFRLIPPLYFLYITRYFTFMLLLCCVSYLLTFFLTSFGFTGFLVYLPLYIPFVVASALILHRLDASQSLLSMLFLPPIFGQFLFIFYLGFFYKPEDLRYLPKKKDDLKGELERTDRSLSESTSNNTANENVFTDKEEFSDVSKFDIEKHILSNWKTN